MFASITRTAVPAIALVATAVLACGSVQAQNRIPVYRPNPTIVDTGKQVSDFRYDPFTGRYVLRTDRTQVRDSYLDPNRGYIDPGSKVSVDEYQTDRNGVRWHLTGVRWTTNGKPHGEVNRRRVTKIGGGIDHDENEFIAYSNSLNPNANKSNANRAKMPRYTKPGPKQSTPPRNYGGRSIPRYNPNNYRGNTGLPNARSNVKIEELMKKAQAFRRGR